MKFNANEYKFLLLMFAHGPNGEPVQTELFGAFFERRCFLAKARDSMRRWQCITYDPFQDVARLLKANVLRALHCGPSPVQELFPNERPLDAPLAQVSAEISQGVLNPTSPVLISHRLSLVSGSVREFAPMPKPKPPDEPPDPGNPSVHAPHAMPSEPMKSCPPAKLSPRLRAACLSCKDREFQGLHDQHEVGEIGTRTTAEILEELLKFVPNLSQEYFFNWYQRVTLEDAKLVNSALRELQLQRRHITNPGGFLNALYLKGIRAKEKSNLPEKK